MSLMKRMFEDRDENQQLISEAIYAIQAATKLIDTVKPHLELFDAALDELEANTLKLRAIWEDASVEEHMDFIENQEYKYGEQRTSN